MTEENDNGRRTTEEHDRTKLHKQNRKLTYRMPNEDYQTHDKRMTQGRDRIDRFRMPGEDDRCE